MSLFNGNEGVFLSTDEANALRATYQERKKKQNIPVEDTVRSEFFGANNIKQLLDTPGCVGIRVYHAKQSEPINGKTHLAPRVVLVGVDANGDDLVSEETEDMKDMPLGIGGSFLGRGPVCPPECSGGPKGRV